MIHTEKSTCQTCKKERYVHLIDNRKNCGTCITRDPIMRLMFKLQTRSRLQKIRQLR